jgi:carbon monoxide dehydrogenase subunit G
VKLENTFEVPVSVDEAWPILLNIERIAPCMPGAALDTIDDPRYEGRVKIKAGPVTVSYGGVLTIESIDEATRTVVLDAQGKEQKGSGTVKALITAQLVPVGDASRVDVSTDLAITGKPAQLGRGLIADVAGKIIGQFAQNLAGELSGSSGTVGAPALDPITADSGPRPASSPTGTTTAPADSLDLLPLLKPHLLRIATGLAVLAVLMSVLRRTTRR